MLLAGGYVDPTRNGLFAFCIDHLLIWGGSDNGSALQRFAFQLYIIFMEIIDGIG